VKTLSDLLAEGVAGRRVLVRADLNVPLDEGKITDDGRVRASLPTLNALINQGARLVVCSHLGRPDGRPDRRYSLEPVARRLSELLGRPVAFDKTGELALMENVRFHPGEEANDPTFARQLAGLGDVFVNDAFGTAHRAHASTVGVAKELPSAAGLLLEKEVQALRGALEKPARPFVAIVGGSKISSKIAVLENLLPRVDRLLIGGAMAFTLIKAGGGQVGLSLV